MITIESTPQEKNENVVPMNEMKELQVGQIADNKYPEYCGHYVMRTAGHDLEVMDLTNSRSGGCWTGNMCALKVRLLRPSESILLRVSNKAVR